MQAEMKEKMDDYNKLLLEKERKHQEIAARDKEIEKLVAQIQELKLSGAEVSKTVHSLEQQLQKMKKVETELKQVILKSLFERGWHSLRVCVIYGGCHSVCDAVWHPVVSSAGVLMAHITATVLNNLWFYKF